VRLNPPAKQAERPAQPTLSNIEAKAEGRPVATLDHSDPFHPAAAGALSCWKPFCSPDPPTATQSDELTQSTWRRKSPPDPDKDDRELDVHEVPSKCSKSADWAKPATFVIAPTAQQSDGPVHVTLDSNIPPGDWGLGTIDQVVPSQRSMIPLPAASAGKTGRKFVFCGLGPAHPTAQHTEVPVHAMEVKPP